MSSIGNTRCLKLCSGLAVAAGGVILISSCGGGDGGAPPSGGPAVIDTASVTRAVADFGTAISVCQDGVSGGVQSARWAGRSPSIRQAMAALQQPLIGLSTKRALALTSTPPADRLGACGGRMGYRNYSHLNGTTTATLAFENFCQNGEEPGQTQLTNGSIHFVNTATPTASGPVTTQLDASSTGVLTTVLKSAAGATVSANALSFSGFKMVVGVPGGTPTAANPDVMTMTEMTLRNDVTGKSYRQTGYRVSGHEDAAGNSSWTLTGRGYRSDGSYFDITTPQPMVQDEDGDTVSGQMRFAGANTSNVVATLVPGATLQVKLSVNGAPLTSVPACVR